MVEFWILLAMVSFESDDHVVQDDATHNPMDSNLKLSFCVNIEAKLSEGLKPSLKSSKCMLNVYTNLNKNKDQ